MIITIDGVAGSGKTTVAQKLSLKLKVPYFDTGALYRAVTYLILKEKIPLSDTKGISQFLSTFDFQVHSQNGVRRYFANHQDVTELIRLQSVTHKVSAVSALEEVRIPLLSLQRKWGKGRKGIFEGRDMGSVVFPKSKIKIFLTASPEIAAKRRLQELKAKNPADVIEVSDEQILQEIKERNQADRKRIVAPLKIPDGAYIIDSSHLSVDEIVEIILKYYIQKRPFWHQFTQARIFYGSMLFLGWCWCKIFYRLKAHGLENYYSKGAILAANHASFLDPIVIASTWPEEIHFLARATLFKNRFLRSLLHHLNTHPVGREGNFASLKKTCALLAKNQKILLFPEGTRSKDGNLSSIKPGIATLLSLTQTAIIPVYIEGTYEIWNRKRCLPKLFGRIDCIFGSPIRWESYSHLNKNEGQQQLLLRLTHELQLLQKQVRLKIK